MKGMLLPTPVARHPARHPALRLLAAVAIAFYAPGLVQLAMGASLTGPDRTTMPPCVFASKSRWIPIKPNLDPGRNSLICTVAGGAAACRHHAWAVQSMRCDMH
jgi:hypothetical protein